MVFVELCNPIYGFGLVSYHSRLFSRPVALLQEHLTWKNASLPVVLILLWLLKVQCLVIISAFNKLSVGFFKSQENLYALESSLSSTIPFNQACTHHGHTLHYTFSVSTRVGMCVLKVQVESAAPLRCILCFEQNLVVLVLNEHRWSKKRKFSSVDSVLKIMTA